MQSWFLSGGAMTVHSTSLPMLGFLPCSVSWIKIQILYFCAVKVNSLLLPQFSGLSSWLVSLALLACLVPTYSPVSNSCSGVISLFCSLVSSSGGSCRKVEESTKFNNSFFNLFTEFNSLSLSSIENLFNSWL